MGRAVQALLVCTFALFAWGCGNSGNEAVIGSGNGGNNPGPGPAPNQNATMNLLFNLNAVQINGSAAVSTIVAQVCDGTNGTGNTLNTDAAATPPGVPKSTQITLSIPANRAASARSVRCFFLNQNQVVISGVTFNLSVTLQPGATVTETAPSNPTSTTATLGTVTLAPNAFNATAVNQTQQFTATGSYTASGASIVATIGNGAITWATGNATVATVSNTGVVTAIANGTTNVTASVANPAGGANVVGAALITVTAGNVPPPVNVLNNVTVTATNNPIGANVSVAANSTQLNVTANVNGTVTTQTANSTFTSSNVNVATVSSPGGLVTASGNATGNTTVTALVNVNGVTSSGNLVVSVINGTPPPPPANGSLVLNSNNVTTVTGGNVIITGTVNGTAINITLATGNSSIATATNNVLTGVGVGTTNFTATGNVNNTTVTAQGNVTVATGTLQNTLVISQGVAITVNEGTVTPFAAQAQFSTGSGTVNVDVTNQCVWIVTNTTNSNTGDSISFDAGAGNFTATRGAGGTVTVGALFSNPSGVATGNTSVTINKVNPTVGVRPAGSANEFNGSRQPTGFCGRLYEAVLTYPNGFQQLAPLSSDITFTNSTGVGSQLAVASFTAGTPRAAVTSPTTPSIQPFVLCATYGNSASGLAQGGNNITFISYTLNNISANFAQLTPTDNRVIPGSGSAAAGYVRPITVLAQFTDRNSATPLVMPFFKNPFTVGNICKVGAISLYYNGAAGANLNFANRNLVTQTGAVALFTSAISPVGYTHVLRNVTNVISNNSLFIRVTHRTTQSLAAAAVGGVNVSGAATAEIAGSNPAAGPGAPAITDRDLARTAQMSNITLDSTTGFAVIAQSNAIAKGKGTNCTVNASYTAVGGAREDVTLLCDFFSYTVNGSFTQATINNAIDFNTKNGQNIRVGNVTNGIGQVKGRVYNQDAPGTTAKGFNVVAKYPGLNSIPGTPTQTSVAINTTLP